MARAKYIVLLAIIETISSFDPTLGFIHSVNPQSKGIEKILLPTS